jgi:hypothetical protein
MRSAISVFGVLSFLLWSANALNIDDAHRSTNLLLRREIPADSSSQKQSEITPQHGDQQTTRHENVEQQHQHEMVEEEVRSTERIEGHEVQAQRQTHEVHAASVERALACLRKTTPDLQLEYPQDAEDHFNEIHAAMGKWLQDGNHKMHGWKGYKGPWIENYWITHFYGLVQNRSKDVHLSTIFGPYIPIFVPWVDHFVNSGFHYPEDMNKTLDRVLRRSVPYVTVSQEDEGLSVVLDQQKYPNVLVLSAGGYGHVAVPLLMRTENISNGKPMDQRQWLMSFVGTTATSPRNLRVEMSDELVKHSTALLASDPHPVDPSRNYHVKVASEDGWREIMADSRVSLTPRGLGRTSFHLAETVQMGLVPVHVFSDIPWIPYPELFPKFGFSIKMTALDDLMDAVYKMPAGELEKLESEVVSARKHFLPEGVIEQISRFLIDRDGGGDLRCQQLPPTVI